MTNSIQRRILEFVLSVLCTGALAQGVRDESPSAAVAADSAATLTLRFQTEAALAQQGLDAGQQLLQNLPATLPATTRKALHQRQQAAEAALQARSDELLSLVQAANATRANDASLQNLRNALGSVPVRIDTEDAPVAAQHRDLTLLRSGSPTRLQPSAADLAATLDAPITPLIEAKAEALNRAPVAIFEWVRKNIGFVPSLGSLQGAVGTLESGRGNATDAPALGAVS